MSYPPSYGSPPGGQPENGLGTASMVLGIIALVLFLTIVIGVVCGVLAIIFGLIGRSRVRQGRATNGGQATAGLVTGIIAIVAVVALALAVLIPTGSHFCVHVGVGSNPCTSN
ncbi:MAG: hypothetical protein QOD07_194 [Frankiaceae bacterium]|jgi:hypothetical protein|nr:hypothetical protein [Frankiaceae bacterium]